MFKKLFTLLLFGIIAFTNVNAQYVSTDVNNINPVRYQKIALSGNEQLVFDTQKTHPAILFNPISYTALLFKFHVNDKDLTNGTPSQNGRYKILISVYLIHSHPLVSDSLWALVGRFINNQPQVSLVWLSIVVSLVIFLICIAVDAIGKHFAPPVYRFFTTKDSWWSIGRRGNSLGVGESPRLVAHRCTDRSGDGSHRTLY